MEGGTLEIYDRSPNQRETSLDKLGGPASSRGSQEPVCGILLLVHRSIFAS